MEEREVGKWGDYISRIRTARTPSGEGNTHSPGEEVINYSGSYVLLGHISNKIGTLLILIHISSPAVLVQTRSKHIAPTHSNRHIPPSPKTRPNFSFKDNAKTKHNHRNAGHILVQLSVVCVLPRLLQVRTIERKTPDSSRFVVQIRAMQKTPKLPNISR